MRITSKGRVTIPKDIREAAGLLPNTEVEFVYDGEFVYVVPSAARGMGAVVTLRAHGRRVRMSTDEIMALTRS